MTARKRMMSPHSGNRARAVIDQPGSVAEEDARLGRSFVGQTNSVRCPKCRLWAYEHGARRRRRYVQHLKALRFATKLQVLPTASTIRSRGASKRPSTMVPLLLPKSRSTNGLRQPIEACSFDARRLSSTMSARLDLPMRLRQGTESWPFRVAVAPCHGSSDSRAWI